MSAGRTGESPWATLSSEPTPMVGLALTLPAAGLGRAVSEALSALVDLSSPPLALVDLREKAPPSTDIPEGTTPRPYPSVGRSTRPQRLLPSRAGDRGCPWGPGPSREGRLLVRACCVHFNLYLPGPSPNQSDESEAEASDLGEGGPLLMGVDGRPLGRLMVKLPYWSTRPASSPRHATSWHPDPAAAI